MAQLPRYVRINVLKITLGAAERGLKQTGHTLERPDKNRNNRYRRKKPDKKKNNRGYTRDPHIRELLCFLPKGKSDLSRIPLVLDGSLVVQQKASCFPALALDPPRDAHVIDACAAPGSKTSHLASLMANTGRLFAFDRSPSRLEAMQRLLAQRGVQNVRATAGDFLEVDSNSPEYRGVTHIMLDPSCSSSGMSARPTTDPTEIAALVQNQIRLIKHAMSFPSANAIVYSTCSIHCCENEEVVEHVVAASGGRWRAVAALPWWPRRGLPPASCAEACVRSTLEDQTIGFFLCRLEKVDLATDPGSGSSEAAAGVITTPAAAAAAAEPLPPQTKQTKRKVKRKEAAAVVYEGGASVSEGRRKKGKKMKRRQGLAVVEEVTS